MTAADLIVTIVTIAATGGIGAADLARAEFVLANSAEVGVPVTWLPALGTLKLLGALGLCAGLAGVQWAGVAAAAGLSLFFVGAVAAHVRAAVFHNIAFPLAYLAASSVSLGLAIAR